MLSAEMISALIKWSLWTKPGLNHLLYFIVGTLNGKKSSHLKGKGDFISISEIAYLFSKLRFYHS